MFPKRDKTLPYIVLQYSESYVKSDMIMIDGKAMGRGRTKLAWNVVLRKEYKLLNLTKHITFDSRKWVKRIYAATPIDWE